MKTDDLKKAANYSDIVEKCSKFDVSLIQSITVQANTHAQRSDSGNIVAVRIWPDDPRYAALEALLRAESADQKTKAEAELTKIGLTVVVDQAVVDQAQADSVAAKAIFDDNMERIRLKKIVAEAVAAGK
jgi:hypothetical protein